VSSTRAIVARIFRWRGSLMVTTQKAVAMGLTRSSVMRGTRKGPTRCDGDGSDYGTREGADTQAVSDWNRGGVFEGNEALAPVAAGVGGRNPGPDKKTSTRWGGAIALGQSAGASGAVLIGRAYQSHARQRDSLRPYDHVRGRRQPQDHVVELIS